MRVSELIKRLSDMEPESEVAVMDDFGYTYYDVGHVDIEYLTRDTELDLFRAADDNEEEIAVVVISVK